MTARKPLKPSEREGRPESPRKDKDTSPPAPPSDDDRAQAARDGNALPDRDESGQAVDDADAGGKQRDTLHVPSRTKKN